MTAFTLNPNRLFDNTVLTHTVGFVIPIPEVYVIRNIAFMHSKEKIATALKKARSSVEKILASVESENPDCFAVIQQNLAVIGLLKSANLLMLENHIERAGEKLSGKNGKKLRDEIVKIVQLAQNK